VPRPGATRNVILAVVASGVLGGSIGALATAATNSSASPAAIAAAVQQVKDGVADNKLTDIEHTLEGISEKLDEATAAALQTCRNTREPKLIPGTSEC